LKCDKIISGNGQNKLSITCLGMRTATGDICLISDTFDGTEIISVVEILHFNIGPLCEIISRYVEIILFQHGTTILQ